MTITLAGPPPAAGRRSPRVPGTYPVPGGAGHRRRPKTPSCRPWWPVALVLLLGLAALTACGGDEDGQPPATPAAEPPSTPAAVASPEQPPIGEIVWATAVEPGTNAPAEPVERFPADAPVLYAVLRVARLPAGSVLVATWAYNDVPIEALDAEVVAESPIDEPIWVAFHLERDGGEPWPEGTYAITISLNGEPVRASSVEVVGRGSSAR